MYLLELAVGFESNIKINSERKSDKYRPLILPLQEKYCNVEFINLSIGAVGIFDKSSTSFSSMLNDLHFDNIHQQQSITKTSSIAHYISLYIFSVDGTDLSQVRSYKNFSCHNCFCLLLLIPLL